MTTKVITKQIDIPAIFNEILENPWLDEKICTRINISIMIYDMNLVNNYYFQFSEKKMIVKTISIKYGIPKSIENMIISYFDYDNLIETIKKKYPPIKPRTLHFTSNDI